MEAIHRENVRLAFAFHYAELLGPRGNLRAGKSACKGFDYRSTVIFDHGGDLLRCCEQTRTPTVVDYKDHSFTRGFGGRGLTEDAWSDMTKGDRKFQVSNGYLLDCDQLARALHYMLEHRSAKKITRQELSEDTGLSNRQIESLVSMGAAMGLVKTGRQTLSTAGLLVGKHDVFLEAKGTLEWCHYMAASNYKNLVWYEVFNSLLVHESPMTQQQWVLYFRNLLTGQYSERTLGKGLNEEVRLVADGYINQKFSRLSLVQLTYDDKLYRRRYIGFEPPILAAMVYDYAQRNQTHLVQMRDLSEQPASPGLVFGVEESGFRQELEALHGRGWVRYETTHGLDQLRLKAELTPDCFLRAYYENGEPVPADQTNTKEGLF